MTVPRMVHSLGTRKACLHTNIVAQSLQIPLGEMVLSQLQRSGGSETPCTSSQPSPSNSKFGYVEWVVPDRPLGSKIECPGARLAQNILITLAWAVLVGKK